MNDTEQTSLEPVTPQPAARRTPLAIWLVTAAVAAGGLLLIVAVARGWVGSAETTADDVETTLAVGRDLLITVKGEEGQVEARNKEIIRSQVRDRVEITWMIEEGSLVEVGDDLVKLDRITLDDKLDDQNQKLENARSTVTASTVNLNNTSSEGDSQIAQAELDVKFAELELRKYKEGEYPQQLKKAQASVEIARETYKRAASRAEWSAKLAEKGYITDSEAEADAAAATKAQLDLEVAEGDLKVLETFTYQQQLARLESDLEQARDKLKRVTAKAAADEERARVQLRTDESNKQRIERELEAIQKDIDNTTITAPVAGRVVYAPQGNRWRRGEPLSKGSEVRQGQEIIHLPERGAMSVAIKIPEIHRDKVEVGMPAVVTHASLPGSGLEGRLAYIAEYADPQGFWNAGTSQYSALIHIDENEDVSMLRTGMNVDASIIVAYLEDVLAVPLQAVMLEGDEHVVYLPGDKEPERVVVETGMDNGSHVHVISGIDENTRVLLAPPINQAAASGENGRNGADEAAARIASSNGQADRDDKDPAASDEQEAAEKKTDPDQARMLQGLKSMREHGMLDRLKLDGPTLAAVNEAIDNLNAGKPAELDEATQNKIKQAFRKLAEKRRDGEGGAR